MNKNLGYYIRDFLDNYLKLVRNFSRNTILSYRDTIKLFLIFNQEVNHLKTENMNLELLNKDNILSFLNWLENDRKCSMNTRNQRLACLKSFCRFILDQDPVNLEYIQNVFHIPFKKHTRKEIEFLSKEEMGDLLRKPDASSQTGRKALIILTLLYDAGLRISELINLKVEDIDLTNEIARIKVLKSKNNKSRQIPITENTKNLLKEFIKEKDSNDYLIVSNKKDKYTPNGIKKIIKKYTDECNIHVTPHTFRHTKASHLVETNIPIIYIRDFLGHESIETTMIYAKINSKLKNEAIVNHGIELRSDITFNLNDDKLIEWLENL